jgi:nucleoside-diphosphate-sugar epimerase
VIHLAFVHNFADYATAAEIDKLAIEAIGDALIGSDKPFVVTSGVPTGAPGHVVTEADDPVPGGFPRQSEAAALPYAARGVRVSIVRPSRFVYQGISGGFISRLVDMAADRGSSAYVGDGMNHIHAVHNLDLAALYRLALENGAVGARYQGVGDGAVPFRDVAVAIGQRLGVPLKSISPEEAAQHFGFLGAIVALDNPASSELTQAELGWKPTHPALLEDLAG